MKTLMNITIVVLLMAMQIIPQGKNVPIQGNKEQLKHFFNALKEAKNKKIRIAHFGDSIIEGDVLTMDFREYMQKHFGGNGAGFISITTDDKQMRQSTQLSFDESKWDVAAIFKRNPNKWPLGIAGTAFQAKGNAWTKYEISNHSKSLKNFTNVRLFYTNAENATEVKCTFDNTPAKSVKLSSGNDVKEVVFKPNSASKWVKFDFDKANKALFYGVSLENGNGVYVDNFPLKGNSGISLIDINVNTLKDFNELLNYKLVIINFGVNVLSPQHKDYSWYEKKMEKVIHQLKVTLPNTSFLLVGVGDKSIKKGTKFVTDPGILELHKSQKQLAEKTGIAFWSQFEAMGGENASSRWAQLGPPLVTADFAHLTYQGGKVVGELLYKALIEEFNKNK